MNRTNNKEFFYAHMDLCWNIFAKYFTYASYLYGLRVHSFVLMSNHYHLIASTPDKNIGDIIKYAQREIAKEINHHSSRINHVFGGKYHWSVLTKNEHYALATKYLFRNPCKAGVCDRVEEYKYSTLSRQNGRYDSLNLKIYDTPESFYDYIDDFTSHDFLDWLNEPFENELDDRVQKALRRTEFKLPKNKNSFSYNLEEFLMRRYPKR